jgi:hypothetical protein
MSGELLKTLGLELPGASTSGKSPTEAKPKAKADAKLAVAARADFVHGSIADIPAAIAALVHREGDGVVSYDPPLATVGMPKKYTLSIRVAEGTLHKADGPVTLGFTILEADPKLTVGKLADFDHGSVVDIPATIAALVKREGAGVISYAPALDTIGAPGTYAIQVSVAASEPYKAAGPLTLAFEIRKLPTTLTLKKFDDFYRDPNKKKNLAVLIPALLDHDGDGTPVYDPPLAELTDKAGDYKVKIWVAEGKLRKKSEEKLLTYKIFLSQAERNTAFEDWKSKAETKHKGMIGKRHVSIFVGEAANPSAPVPKFTSADEIRDALNVIVKADLPMKDHVWAALGHPSLKGKADWKLGGNWETSKGVKMHLTISYDNIQVPQTKAGWGATAAALYTSMFEGPPIDARVHVTLESAPTESGKVRLYAGGTNGRGDPWAATAFNGQMGEMMTKLAEFKAGIIAKIPDAKTALKVP